MKFDVKVEVKMWFCEQKEETVPSLVVQSTSCNARVRIISPASSHNAEVHLGWAECGIFMSILGVVTVRRNYIRWFK